MIDDKPKGLRAHLPILYPAVTLVVFFVIPFGIMLAVSFFQREPGGFYTTDFSSDNYANLFTVLFSRVLVFSVFISALCAAICVAVGFPFTYFITRMRRKAQVVWLVILVSVLSLSAVIVAFPMVCSYMVSGYAFCFVLSLNEYIVAYMVSGFTVETLPIKIFNALRYGYTPVMAAVTVFFVLLAALIFGLIGRFGDLPRLMGALAPESRNN